MRADLLGQLRCETCVVVRTSAVPASFTEIAWAATPLVVGTTPLTHSWSESVCPCAHRGRYCSSQTFIAVVTNGGFGSRYMETVSLWLVSPAALVMRR